MTIEVGKVGMIPIDSIIIGERARQDMGDLDSTEDNMKQIGLTTPLTVLKTTNGSYKLLAGERRLTILKRNGNTEVPARIYEDELSDLEMKIIEKSENFYRKDFEYWEYDKLVLEITQLEQQLVGTKGPGPSSAGHGLAETGEMLGVSKATVSQAIKRAEAREAFPELFENCRNASDATKVIKKLDEAIVKQAIAQKIEQCKIETPLHKLASCFIIKDFFEGVKQIPDSSMHLVEIDPPYAIDLHEAKKSEGESQYILQDYNEVPTEKYQVFLANTLKECYRVMADHSWLICWFAPEPWMETIYRELSVAGFTTTRMCGIWNKGYGQNKRPEIHLSNSYEMFFYAWKGRPALNKPGRSNVFNFSPVPSTQKTHPTERPIDLMMDLYDTFAFPGSRILIPFLGSGVGLLAAHHLGMSGVGFELGKSHNDSFLVRVHNMKG